MKSEIMANIIYYIHFSLVIFVLIGFAILPAKWLVYYIILGLIIMLDWNDFDGMCILTKVEHYFRTGEWVLNPEDERPEFFRPILRKIIGIDISRNMANKISNFVFLMVILIGFIRYNWYCMNNKK
jgi:hypothetical protein